MYSHILCLLYRIDKISRGFSSGIFPIFRALGLHQHRIWYMIKRLIDRCSPGAAFPVEREKSEEREDVTHEDHQAQRG